MQASNVKAMREAVKELLDAMYDMGVDEETVSIAAESPNCHMHSAELLSVIKRAKAALAEPVRNCDVGSADKQGERFKNFCRNHQFISVDSEDGFPLVYVCSNESCPLHDYYIVHGEDNCELAWAQMPYEKGDNDGGK